MKLTAKTILTKHHQENFGLGAERLLTIVGIMEDDVPFKIVKDGKGVWSYDQIRDLVRILNDGNVESIQVYWTDENNEIENADLVWFQKEQARRLVKSVVENKEV